MEARLYHGIRFDIGRWMRQAEASPEYGLLPLLARRYVGNVMSEGYSERAISIANDVLTPGNASPPSKDINGLVVLRADREFMRKHVDPVAPGGPPPPPIPGVEHAAAGAAGNRTQLFAGVGGAGPAQN